MREFENGSMNKLKSLNRSLFFISSRDVNETFNGGYQCTNRNYKSFCEILGADNVEVLNLTFGMSRIIDWKILTRVYAFIGFKYGLSPKKLKHICANAMKFNYVFIDSSVYGIIAKRLKNAGYKGKIFCFFHNVEYNINRQILRKNPMGLMGFFLAIYNERLACKYSDNLIVLNQRDGSEVARIYGKSEISLIPVSLEDSFENPIRELTSIPPTFLFLGSKWYANVHGLRWFVNNVLDQVDIRLQIVGSSMDKLKKEFEHPKIEFLGFVSDLSLLLKSADYVLSPIFLGSGMKVKICEFLMYGKNIIGSSETFEGYEIDYKMVGAVCDTKDEFIQTIVQLSTTRREKYNEQSRNYYLEKYSFNATLRSFSRILDE